MRVIIPGHRYELAQLDIQAFVPLVILQFVQRKVDADPNRKEYPGTINQEVLRVLIDRMKFLNAEKPWYGNDDIITNLRQCILMHELRAYEQKLHKAGFAFTVDGPICEDDLAYIVTQWRLTTHLDTQIEAIPVGEDGHWVIPLELALS